jgi:hypothetical protein
MAGTLSKNRAGGTIFAEVAASGEGDRPGMFSGHWGQNGCNEVLAANTRFHQTVGQRNGG